MCISLRLRRSVSSEAWPLLGVGTRVPWVVTHRALRVQRSGRSRFRHGLLDCIPYLFLSMFLRHGQSAHRKRMRSNWKSQGCLLDTLKPELLRHSQQHDHVVVHVVPSGSFSIFPKHVHHVHGQTCSCHRTQPGEIQEFAARQTGCDPPWHV